MIQQTSSIPGAIGRSPGSKRRVLWWGRSDPAYARNAILRGCLSEAGFQIEDFRPWVSAAGDAEARLRVRRSANLVWVPSFRQRDVAAAKRFSVRHALPLVFDPLISAYDKQVNERVKFSAEHSKARRLLAWERLRFCAADLLLADTPAHADYFHRLHGVPRDRLGVVPMSADESLFVPSDVPATGAGPLEVLFFGSFLPLQGPEVIVAAANRYRGPAVRWCLLGNGPGLDACRALVKPGTPVEFEDWLAYEHLPARIARAHVVVGIFGDTPKAARVVPNKVCQALACGRPLVTRRSPALPPALGEADSGVILVAPADPQALADAVATLAASPGALKERGQQAYRSYRRHFSRAQVASALTAALDRLFAGPAPGPQR